MPARVKNKNGIRIGALMLVLLTCFSAMIGLANSESKAEQALLKISTAQTSAAYMHEYMQARYEGGWESEKTIEEERQRLVLVSDIYIKAWSYAFWNKFFFFISIILALLVLIWPSISAIAPKKLGDKPIFKSAVVQTTITAIAAACFFVYSDYKEKQMSAENLMRYVIHSEDELPIISSRVIDELMRIDKGLSFIEAVSKTTTVE